MNEGVSYWVSEWVTSWKMNRHTAAAIANTAANAITNSTIATPQMPSTNTTVTHTHALTHARAHTWTDSLIYETLNESAVIQLSSPIHVAAQSAVCAQNLPLPLICHARSSSLRSLVTSIMHDLNIFIHRVKWIVNQVLRISRTILDIEM